MGKDLLLVIDMQNVYLPGGMWQCPGMPQVLQNILRLTERCSNAIFTQFLPPLKPIGCWQTYNRVNASVNDNAHANSMVDELSDALTRFPLYPKSTYSSLSVPEVLNAARKADRVVVTGVVAECCVLATVMALIDVGIPVVYLTDAVAGVEQATENAAITVLTGLSPVHLELMTTDAYLSTV